MQQTASTFVLAHVWCNAGLRVHGVQAYELRWRLANPGFLPMKAAQRFMRPVKEIREGFFTMEDDVSSSGDTNSGGSHATSATRHFEEQYSSRAAEAGLLSNRTQSSRMSTPRGSIPALSGRSSSPVKHTLGFSNLSPRRMVGTGTESFQPGSHEVDMGQSADLEGAASLLQHQPV